jgi:Cryptococcal mannosyltransferase 1
VYGDHIPLTDFPRIVMPTGETALKRLTYLTEVRNRMMRPLDDPPPTDTPSSSVRANYTDTRFDRVLFLNDIYFRPEDALHILFNTNLNPTTGRAEYSVACALDFSKLFWLYDTFVIRDADGYGIASLVYPWFHTAGSARSRADVLAQRDAVRVRSCWSGLAAYDARPFLKTAAAPPHGPGPLRFRHEPELYWEASECCLLNADVALRPHGGGDGGGVVGGAGDGIFANPYVRVAYDRRTLLAQRVVQRFERAFAPAQGFLAARGWSAPEENPRRADVAGREAEHRKWLYAARPDLDGERARAVGFVEGAVGRGEWRDVSEEAVPGGFCGQRRLFVLAKDLVGANSDGRDKNWIKMPVPPDYGS